MVCGCTKTKGIKGNISFEGTTNAEWYMLVWSSVCLRQLIFQPITSYFSETMKPHSAALPQHSCTVKRRRVTDCPACSPDLSPSENSILGCENAKQKPHIVKQIKLYIKQEWERIPFQNKCVWLPEAIGVF